MREDSEGFLYPEVDPNLCTHCGLCKRVCPNESIERLLPTENQFDQKAYAAIHKNEEVVYSSSSGGMFSAIIDVIFERGNSVIFGVELDNNFQAVHSYAENVEDTQKFRKSKYIQSNIGNSYEVTAEFLKTGRRVLFTGTPCQVAGLRTYLGKSYDNLLCVDIICKGVPSQKIFDVYRDYIEKKFGGIMKSFSFRHKTFRDSEWYSRNVSMEINSEKIVSNNYDDPYLKGFHSRLFFRPSCYECSFSCPTRVSDITLGDFWNIEKLNPDLDPHKGVSLVLCNSAKGKEILLDIEEHKDVILTGVSRDFVVKNVGNLNFPSRKPPKRESFFAMLDSESNSFEKSIESCLSRNVFYRLLEKAASRLPNNLKNVIRRLSG